MLCWPTSDSPCNICSLALPDRQWAGLVVWGCMESKVESQLNPASRNGYMADVRSWLGHSVGFKLGQTRLSLVGICQCRVLLGLQVLAMCQGCAGC